MTKELREEMAGTLMAISIVNKSLAKKVMKGEKVNEQNETSTRCGARPKKSSK